MFSDLTTPVPAWLVEGFAEFMSTADIKADGSVGLGGGAAHRAGTLSRPSRATVPLTVLLSGERLRTNEEIAALYARGWLLTHYLTFSTARRGQLEAISSLRRRPHADRPARSTFGDIVVSTRNSTPTSRRQIALPHIPAAQVKTGR